MNEMALVVPSRGRPQNIARLLNQLRATESEVDLYVGVDSDDPSLEGYQDLLNHYEFELVVSPVRERFGPTLNRIFMDLKDDYPYLAWMGDDHFPRTYKWDERYRQELEKLKVGIVYGDDLNQGENIATQLAMTSNMVQALEYAVPEGFIHLYIDNYFMELAKSIDRLKYLPDVVVEHLHPTAGQKAQYDLTYTEANSKENWTNDRARFERYMSEELQLDAEKLRTLL